MSVELYEMEHSPYCIPIARALVALGVPYESKLVPNWDRSAVIRLTEGVSLLSDIRTSALVSDGRNI